VKNDAIKFKKNGEITVTITPTNILTRAWLTRKPNQTDSERITELITKGLEAEEVEVTKQLKEQFRKEPR
jgi:hypothetical protein